MRTVIILLLVLHHLDKTPNGECNPMIESVLSKANKVLKPDGLLLMTASTRENLSAHWFVYLNEACHQSYGLKMPKGKTYLDMIKKNGFNVINFLGALGHANAPSNYTDVEGPLQKSFRDTDSFWSVFSDEELTGTLDYIRFLKNSDKLKEFYDKHDKLNEKGYFDIIMAMKN